MDEKQKMNIDNEGVQGLREKAILLISTMTDEKINATLKELSTSANNFPC